MHNPFILMMVGVFSLSHIANAVTGIGSVGCVYYQQDERGKDVVARVELLDLWEARLVDQLPLIQSQTIGLPHSPENEEELGDLLTTASRRLEKADPVFFRSFQTRVDAVRKALVLLSPELVPMPTTDYNLRQKPDEGACILKPVAFFRNQTKLEVSSLLVNHLPLTHVAALLLTQAIAQLKFNFENQTDTDEARLIVGHLLSTQYSDESFAQWYETRFGPWPGTLRRGNFCEVVSADEQTAGAVGIWTERGKPAPIPVYGRGEDRWVLRYFPQSRTWEGEAIVDHPESPKNGPVSVSLLHPMQRHTLGLFPTTFLGKANQDGEMTLGEATLFGRVSASDYSIRVLPSGERIGRVRGCDLSDPAILEKAAAAALVLFRK